MSTPFTTKLSSDSYKRPTKTKTEQLTDDQVEEKLDDYKEVADISKVPLGTHLRYFSILKDGTKKFRYGGVLYKNAGLPDYVILSNGKSSWTVQVKTSVFWKKMSLKEIKDEYEEYIDGLEEENKKLKLIIQNMTHHK